jgi:hypothetical protein
VIWETNQSSSLSHYPHTKQSLRYSFVLEVGEEVKMTEVGVEGVMELARDFADESARAKDDLCTDI